MFLACFLWHKSFPQSFISSYLRITSVERVKILEDSILKVFQRHTFKYRNFQQKPFEHILFKKQEFW